MAASVVVALRTAIIAGLAARPGLVNVQVTYGWPGDDEAQIERVFTNRPRATHEPASLRAGRNYRDELGELDVVIQVAVIGGTSSEADTRALELGREVEEYVADNKSGAGVAGVLWLTVTGWELHNLYNDAGSLTELTYTISHRARLT